MISTPYILDYLRPFRGVAISLSSHFLYIYENTYL